MLAAVGTQNIDFLAGSLYIFARHKWRPNKLRRCIGSKNIGFLAGKCTFLVTEEGMLAAVGTQNIDFLAGKCIFLQGTSGGQTNCVDAL